MVMLFLAGCQAEEVVKDNHEHGEKVIAKNVDFSSFQNKVISQKSNLQFEKLDVLKNDASKHRESVGLIHTIFTNEIFYMEMENGMTTYTLKASTNLENDQAITNIVYFSQNGNDFDYKVIRYFPSENWLESYRNNPNTLFSGTIEGFNSTQVELTGVTYAKGGSMQCPIDHIPVWRCAAGNTHSIDDFISGRCEVGHNFIIGYNTIWGDCPNNGGGESSGGGNPGNNENPEQEIIEIPTKPVVFQSFFQTFYNNSLNFDQQQYLNNNSEPKAEIENYINSQGMVNGNVSAEVEAFAIWAVEYLRNHPNVTIEQFKNWFMTPREGHEILGYDQNYWENPNLNFPQQNLPSWNDFNTAYPRLDGAVLVQAVGGLVQQAYNQYPNLSRGYCALKVSWALNYSGVTIPQIITTSGNPGTVQGADGKYYFLNAKALNKWMRETFGTFPDNPNHYNFTAEDGGTNGENFPTLVAGFKGIYSMVSTNPQWASGHADLIDNSQCVFGCHFNDSPPAPIDYIDIWILD
ncbi:hypothetical protein GV828_09900 [Flavobacterium sp. NST-5]|uniref:Uncharacterized protein n=1 Tax=Flavobacterium ichthyis TaxID=2698827 RepID=A0ABW9ZAD7_9FLAO|nr:T6SS effector amidase Tae4 family protein [Flavobacterium ichthyis]NBL65512.1 hypothetical protein [Flavobacterium ichthyis]